MGPFAASAQASGSSQSTSNTNPMDGLIPTTIFMDITGSCHLDLDPSDDRRMAQQLYKAQSDSGLLSEVVDEMAARQVMQMAREKHEQARAAQAHSMYAHAAMDRTPAARGAVRRMHMINQPRRFN